MRGTLSKLLTLEMASRAQRWQTLLTLLEEKGLTDLQAHWDFESGPGVTLTWARQKISLDTVDYYCQHQTMTAAQVAAECQATLRAQAWAPVEDLLKQHLGKAWTAHHPLVDLLQTLCEQGEVEQPDVVAPPYQGPSLVWINEQRKIECTWQTIGGFTVARYMRVPEGGWEWTHGQQVANLTLAVSLLKTYW